MKNTVGELTKMEKYYVKETIKETPEGEKLQLVEVDKVKPGRYKYLLIFKNGDK